MRGNNRGGRYVPMSVDQLKDDDGVVLGPAVGGSGTDPDDPYSVIRLQTGK